jgi:hypothetical protein
MENMQIQFFTLARSFLITRWASARSLPLVALLQHPPSSTMINRSHCTVSAEHKPADTTYGTPISDAGLTAVSVALQLVCLSS